PVVVAPPALAEVAVERVRQGLRDAVAGLEPDPRGLVPALVVGDTTAMPADLVEQFRTTGLTHLTAVSGANLTLLLASLSLGARWIGLRGWWLRGCLVLGVLGFVALCRAEPSVVRAAAMGMAGLAALGMGKRAVSQGIRLLCVAVIGVLLIDPWMARSLGFTLSVLASAGIIWWARPWTDALATWLPRPLAEACCVPLAAQLATQPVVTAISGQISVVGLVANVVAGPLVGPATVLGFGAAAVSVLWLPPASLLGWLAGWCAQALCWIARLGALVPGAATSWPTTPAAVVLVSIACLAAASLVPRLLAIRWLCVLLATGLIVILVRPPGPPGWPPPEWQVVACDVGQGDAIVLRAGPQEAVLVDVGPDPDGVARCLAGLGIRRVPLVVLTHFHADHVGGLGGLAQLGVEQLVISAVTSPDYGFQGVLADAPGAQRTIAQAGAVVTVGAVQLTFVSARPILTSSGDEGESAAENDSSLVMRARVGELSVLLAGDLQEAGQEHALRTAGDLGVDVLVVPHHGSGHQLPAFLAASRARIAIFSVGADNDYGHPAPRIVRLIQDLGMTIARTDLQGSIGIRRRGTELLLTVQR
ncbi:MAG: ComEC/Rec2 family competence protein, partial [Micropruina sp.]